MLIQATRKIYPAKEKKLLVEQFAVGRFNGWPVSGYSFINLLTETL
jgi:hypothetical protein